MTVQAPPVAAGAIIESLEGITREIRELAKGMETPAPGMFRAIEVNRTHVRIRVREWVLAVEAEAGAEVVTLTVGSAIVATVVVTAEVATLVIPLPITIERGTDVVTNATGTVHESYLIYYPE
jgi:hypothetical protein